MAISKSSKDDQVNIARLPWEPDKCPDLFPLVTEWGDKSPLPPCYAAFPELLLPEDCGMRLAASGEMMVSVHGLCNQSFGYRLVISRAKGQDIAVCVQCHNKAAAPALAHMWPARRVGEAEV